MKKVTEINIIGEGMQLKQILEENYTYSVMSKRFGVSRSSIARYLSSMQITTSKFRDNIEELFQKPFNEIINPVEDQIRNYLLEIKDKIDHYNKPTDNAVMNDLYEYAMGYSPFFDQILARGNIAMYKYNMGLHNDAEKLLKEIINISKEHNYKEHIVYYTLQLAFIYLDYDLKKTRKTLYDAEAIINGEVTEGEVSKVTLFNYYHFFGIILRRTKKIKDAREMFKKAIDCKVDDIRTAKALSNIGLTYYDEKKYTYALNWSEKALKKCAGNVGMESGIYNNMANMHYQKGEIVLARYRLSEAMKNFTDDFDPGRKILIYDTYLDFYAQEGARLLEVVLKVFKNCTVINQYQGYLATCVEKLLHQLQENGDFVNIKELFFNLNEYTKSEGEKRYIGELKVLVVDMMHLLMENGQLEVK